MKISDLYQQTHRKQVPDECYIIGTGPSMDLFPHHILKDRFCVLLNDATQHFPELGPVAFTNRKDFVLGTTCPIKIVKGRLKDQKEPSPAERDDNHCAWDDPEHYVFSYRCRQRGREWDAVDHFDESCLFNEQDRCHYWNVWKGSVSIFAAQFLCWAGAKVIYLVGCDCCDFQAPLGAGDRTKPRDYLEGKSQRLHVKREFSQYAAGMLKLRAVAREKFGVEIVSLTPFIGLGYHQEQWETLRK